jgi:hypothetical protein
VCPAYLHAVCFFGVCQLDFNLKFFDSSLRQFDPHVITLEEFMQTVAPTLWPENQRIVRCFDPRMDEPCRPHDQDPSRAHAAPTRCRVDGIPSALFWESFGISFIGHQGHGSPFEHNVAKMQRMWEERLPVSLYPVLALSSPPALYPLPQEHRAMQRLLTWNQPLLLKFRTEMDTLTKGQKVLAFHLRGGTDWTSMCLREVVGRREFMSSPQCREQRDVHVKEAHVKDLSGIHETLIPLSMCVSTLNETVHALTALLHAHNSSVLFIGSDCNECARTIKAHMTPK